MNIPDELKQHLTADDLATLAAAVNYTMKRIIEGSTEWVRLKKVHALLTELHFQKFNEEHIAKN